MARRLKQVHATHGGAAIGVIGSNHTTNEENYLLNRFARATLGTNNIDHHRTADYTGLAAALGPNAKNSLATMADIYNAQANLPDRQRRHQPESARRLADSHRRAPSQRKLYVINGQPSKIHRQAAMPCKVAEGARSERDSLAGLRARGIRLRRPHRDLVQLKAALEAATECGRSFRREHSRRGHSRSGFLRPRASAARRRFMALGDYANSRGAADMGVLPDRLPGYAPLSDASERARFGKIWGAELPPRRASPPAR